MLFAPWIREVLASAVSQRVTSAMTLLFVLGAAATVLMTAGRAAGVEAAVLAEIDSAGTRTLTVRTTSPDETFTAPLIARLAQHDDVIEEVIGLGPVVDVTAAAHPGGRPVAMQTVYGSLDGVPVRALAPVADMSQALATQGAIDTLGLTTGAGSVTDATGQEAIITGHATLPEQLKWMEPAVLIPGDATRPEPLAALVIVAAEPADLELVTTLVTDALSEMDPDDLTIETSQRLADVRAAIGGELTRQSRSIVLGVVGASCLAILVNVWSLALTRRKDFGRRRALGATRTMIIGLLVSQVGTLAIVGSLAGVALGLSVLQLTGSPQPDLAYIAAVAVAVPITAAAVAVLPSAWAATRDPLSELRVP